MALIEKGAVISMTAPFVLRRLDDFRFHSATQGSAKIRMSAAIHRLSNPTGFRELPVYDLKFVQ
jgi:hypothetical protein